MEARLIIHVYFTMILVSTMSSDAKQSESYEGKDHKASKTDKQSFKPESSRTDVQDNHKSEDNIPLSSGQPSESVPIVDSILNPSKEAKQMQENDGNQVPTNVEISDGIASSLKQNPVETSSIKDEVCDNEPWNIITPTCKSLNL